MRHIKYLTAFSVMGIVMASALPANAIATFNSINVSTLSGTNDSNDPYTDDVLVDKLTFTGATFDANGSNGNSFRAVQRLTVTGTRSQTNAEWGDNDDNNDGNDNPLEKAGYGGQNQETTDPTIQDATLLEAFNSRSLSEMADGESGGNFGYKMIFENGLTDNDNNADDVPEIILFERGSNDKFDIQLITGGTFDNPTLTNVFTSDNNNSNTAFSPTGINVNTKEITNSQEIGVLGLDFNDFGLSGGDIVYGMVINADSGQPDLNGTFLASEDPSRFTDVPSNLSGEPVPFEAEGSMGLVALGGYAFYRYRKNRKQAFSKHN